MPETYEPWTQPIRPEEKRNYENAERDRQASEVSERHQGHARRTSRIAKLVQTKLKTHWIVSYDDAPEIAALYPNSRHIRYVLNYSAQTKRSGGELIFFSDKLQYPNTNNPALYQNQA